MKIIISAILAFAENEKIQKTLLDGIREIIRSEIGEALKNLNFSRTEIEKSENCKISKTSKNKNRKMLRLPFLKKR